MAFGIDDAILLMMAAASTAQAMNPPENNFQNAAQPGQAGAPGQQPLSQPMRFSTTAPGQAGVDAQPMQKLASELAKQGPPPQAQQQPAPMPTTGGGQQQMGPPAPQNDPIVQAQKNEAATASLWAALPQAIAMAAPLLGAGGEDGRQYAAPVAGQAVGTPTMSSPVKRPSIGEILNSLPRM